MIRRDSNAGVDLTYAQLTELVPLGSLSEEGFNEVIGHAVVERVGVGRRLFRQGDTDGDTVYVLAGEVELTANDGDRRVIVGGEDQGRYALANLKPRRYTAVTLTDATLIRVDSQLLDRVVGWDQVIRTEVDGYEVTDLGDGQDTAWMVRLMHSKVLRQLPTASLRPLFTCMERVEYASGDTVIRQGDAGDFYYLIVSGRCLVSRKSERRDGTVELATLGEGDSFGEEALISGAPRNATVTMLTAGVLMRLAKKDFVELLEEPLLKRVKPRQASAKVKAGAGILDVRLESEYRNGTLKGAVNLPLYLLRLKASALDPKRPYVVFCDTGARSAAAAFLLSERGFEAYVLDGGLAKYNKLSDAPDA